MDTAQIRKLQPMLAKYLEEFDDCFSRSEPAENLRVYVNGQLSDLARKSIEPMADRAGVPPRTLQHFLSRAHWDEARMADRLAQIVARDHAHPLAVAVLDETGNPKKGRQTPGVKPQWCGATHKVDNCVVTVHLGYVAGAFHTLLRSELFLPEDWSRDRPRCRAAGIPDEVVHRPKWRIALDLRDAVVAQGVRLAWMTGDEGYGQAPEFLFALDDRGQSYVMEVPCQFHGWLRRPAVLQKQHHLRHGPGPAKRFPRVKAQDRPVLEVRNMVRYGQVFRRQPWEKFYVKDTTLGPLVWEAKAAALYLKRDGLPTWPHWLVVARNVLDPNEIKYFVSNAPAGTPLEVLLHVAFQRVQVEMCFEEEKGELGMDHFEVRNWRSLRRHLIVSAVSHLFLARVRQAWGEKKSRTDGLPTPAGRRRPGPLALDDRAGGHTLPRTGGRAHHRDPAPQRQGPTRPCGSPQAAVA
jgi:SRSO17 transposase